MVRFAGPAWIALAREILSELAAVHATPETRFSVCEVFTNAPPDVESSRPGVAAWHFYVEGKDVRVVEGEVDDVEIKITADYASALRGARTSYPSDPTERARIRAAMGLGQGQVVGDMSRLPPWLLELHNGLAARTA